MAGEVPEWYVTIRAAQYLGVAPWELEDRSVMWSLRAMEAMKAEREAAKRR